jgi:hypothetical protein
MVFYANLADCDPAKLVHNLFDLLLAVVDVDARHKNRRAYLHAFPVHGDR